MIRVNLSNNKVSTLKFKYITTYIETRIVKCGDEVVNLTTTEYELLLQLIRHENKVLTRDYLLEHVWGYDYDAETNVVDVYIRHLRSKLKNDDYIHTVRGVGYALR